jgi:hypothetical protein
MHLLIIILQQLLGMLPSEKKVPAAEVVRPRQPDPRGSDPNAYNRLELVTASFGIVSPMPLGNEFMPHGVETLSDGTGNRSQQERGLLRRNAPPGSDAKSSRKSADSC